MEVPADDDDDDEEEDDDDVDDDDEDDDDYGDDGWTRTMLCWCNYASSSLEPCVIVCFVEFLHSFGEQRACAFYAGLPGF